MLPEFEGQPYLVAKLARQGTAQIGFFQGHAKIYPDENPEDAFSRNVAGYRILLSPNMNPYNLIVGDDVRKQLDAWEIKDIGLDDFGLL